jgi:hypothetical protein
LGIDQKFLDLLIRNGIKRYEECRAQGSCVIEFFDKSQEKLQPPPQQSVAEPDQMPIPTGEVMPTDEEMLFYSGVPSAVDDEESKGV